MDSIQETTGRYGGERCVGERVRKEYVPVVVVARVTGGD